MPGLVPRIHVLLIPGFKADVNVVDYDRLHLHPPKVHYDLSVGGRRLLQQVDGYDATIVSGVVTHGRADWCAARKAARANSAWRRVRPQP
jgi:N-acyl-D-aspartate/D-glutamate deacylase